MSRDNYLGTGMKFPIEIDPATGRVKTSSAVDSVRESIYLILMTAKTERFARPDFGASLEQYTFMDVTTTTLNVLRRNLIELIMEQEPRIERLEVTPEPDLDNGRLIINIQYAVAGDYTVGSLVFPFYLNVTQEDEPQENDEFRDEADSDEEVYDE